MKKLIFIILSLALLTSCSAFDNQANHKEIDNAQKSAVSEAYAGYSNLLEKDYEKFKLPSNIESIDIAKVYELSCNIPKNNISREDIIEIYRSFYGDNFNEDNLFTDEHGGVLYQAGENMSAYWGMDLSLTSEDYSVTDGSSKEYDTYIDKNEKVKFNNDDITIGDISDNISDDINKLLSSFYPDYTIKVETIKLLDDSNAEFICSLSKDNVSFQYLSSEYLSYDADNMVYWAFSPISGIYGDDGIKMVNASAPNVIVEKTELNEIISVTEAVELLEKELANNMDLEFSDIRLMYCFLTSQPAIDRINSENAEQAEKLTEEYNLKEKKYEPVWCFEIKSEADNVSKQYIKVNAITGELFVDMRG